MAAANNDKLLTLQVLEIPAGNKVLETFFRELVSTKDIQGSVDKAKEVAEENGILLPLQISSIVDLLMILGPPITKQLQSHKKVNERILTRTDSLLRC